MGQMDQVLIWYRFQQILPYLTHSANRPLSTMVPVVPVAELDLAVALKSTKQPIPSLLWPCVFHLRSNAPDNSKLGVKAKRLKMKVVQSSNQWTRISKCYKML